MDTWEPSVSVPSLPRKDLELSRQPGGAARGAAPPPHASASETPGLTDRTSVQVEPCRARRPCRKHGADPGRPDPGFEAGSYHQSSPLGAVGLRAGREELRHGHVRNLVAEGLNEERWGSGGECLAESHEAPCGEGPAERRAESTAPFDPHALLQSGQSPAHSPSSDQPGEI